MLKKPHTTTLGDKLKHHMTIANISGLELAQRACLKPSFVYDILNGKSLHPSAIKLAKITKILGLKLEQLIDEVSHMTDEPNQFYHAHYSSIPALCVKYSPLKDTVLYGEDEHNSLYFPNTWIEQILGSDTRVLRVVTISTGHMSPILNPDDLVMLDITQKSSHPKNNIFILFDGKTLIAKRVEWETPSILLLHSDNPDFKTERCEASTITLLGRVVWFGRQIEAH